MTSAITIKAVAGRDTPLPNLKQTIFFAFLTMGIS
jgi:hypothetical protein